MRARFVFATVCAVVVVMWSASDAGAQTCPDDATAPQATSEQVDFTGVVPGGRHTWSTTVTNAADDPVAVRASLDGTGALSTVLRIGLRTCSTPWVTNGTGPPSCPAGAVLVLAATTLDDGIEVDLPTLAPGDSSHALFSAELPLSTGNEFQGAVGAVRSLMVWQQQCGPATPTTAPGPPTTAPGPPTTAPGPPTAVPVTVPPSAPPSPGAPPTAEPPSTPRSSTPRASTPRSGGPGRPGTLPFTGSPITLTLAVAGGLLATGAAVLAAGFRPRRGDEGRRR